MKDYKPTGLFINQNDKGQYVFSDFFIKGGYLLLQRDYEKYRIYSMRYTISIIVIALLSTFISMRIAILVGILTAIVGELLFRIKFLKTLTYLPDYKRVDNKTLLDTLTTSSDNNKKIIKAILCVALSILIVINAYQQHYSQTVVICCWVISVIAFIFALLFVISYFKEKNK